MSVPSRFTVVSSNIFSRRFIAPFIISLSIPFVAAIGTKPSLYYTYEDCVIFCALKVEM